MTSVRISVVPTPAGTFFLSADSRGAVVDPVELAFLLFARDPATFYGTAVSPSSLAGRQGIELAASEAIRFFAADSFINGEVVVEWDVDIYMLRQVAALLRDALEKMELVPDFEQWKQGKQAWKLNVSADRRLNELLSQADAEHADGLRVNQALVRDWLNRAIADQVDAQGEVAASLQDTLAKYPLLNVLPPSSFATEADWLEAVGFGQDALPFQVCLELREPVDDAGLWMLRILLRDKDHAEHVFALPGQGVPGEEECPAPWLAHLDAVERTVRAWRALCPWLDPDDQGSAGGAEEERRPPTGQYVGDLVRLRRDLDANEAWTFLTEVAPVLVEAGFPVLVPPWWDEVRRNRLRMKARVSAPSGSTNNAVFGIQQLVSFDWRVAVGDTELSEADFERLLAQKQRLIRVQGRWIELRPELAELVKRTTQRYKRKRGFTFADALALVLLGSEEVSDAEVVRSAESANVLHNGAGEGVPSVNDAPQAPVDVEFDHGLQRLLHSLQNVQELPILETPSGFRGQLRPYQRIGFSWLVFLRTHGLGACLADDMGLGKTVQYTAYLLHSRRDPDSAPSRGGPDGPCRFRTPALLICPTSVLGNWQKELARFAPELRVYLHYGSGRKRGDAFVDAVADADVVLTSYSLCHLDSDTLQTVEWDSICLDEAQNIKNPHTKQASAIRKFTARHRIAMTGTPVENRLTELWSIFEFINPGYLGSLKTFQEQFQRPIERKGDDQRAGQLRRLVAPFLLRRVKQDPAVELDLPEKMESKVFVPLTKEQAALYEAVVQDMLDKLESLSAMERRGLILATLTKLKQVCNYPSLFLKESVGRSIAGRSAKLDRLLEMVGELRTEGDSCLIFTQFVEAGRLLEHALTAELGDRVLFLHGGLNKSTRDAMVSEFQSEQGARILILSLKAGGVGLNLTAANHVFHFDRWWNPAVENQATDRAYRIGQTRHVQVHKFVTLGTLEERIDEMIEQKTALSEQIVGSGEQWITELSTSELRELFQLRREWGIEDE